MTTPPDDHLGFVSDEDVPIPYMARTREYYQAIGYTTPYRWAHYVDVEAWNSVWNALWICWVRGSPMSHNPVSSFKVATRK